MTTSVSHRKSVTFDAKCRHDPEMYLVATTVVSNQTSKYKYRPIQQLLALGDQSVTATVSANPTVRRVPRQYSASRLASPWVYLGPHETYRNASSRKKESVGRTKQSPPCVFNNIPCSWTLHVCALLPSFLAHSMFYVHLAATTYVQIN